MEPRIKNGQQIEITIERLSFTGKGIGRVNNFVVFVPHTIPGDNARVEITSVKRRYADARVVEYLKRSEDAIQPRCQHFDLCGGCSFQNLPYELQLKAKLESVTSHLIRIGKFENPPIEPILPADEIFFYRNKMEFSFKPDDQNHLNLGLHHRGDWENIFDVTACQLQSEISNQIVTKTRDFFCKLKIPAYHLSEHHGYLRFLGVRESRAENSIMLILVTNAGQLDRRDEFIGMITSNFPQVKSIVHVINSAKANIATGEDPVTIWGEDYIVEKIADKSFKIRPTTFFQTNTKQTEALYSTVAHLADFSDTENVLDLYTGCGSIALYISGLVNSVYGVELNPEAVTSAHENADLNNITNCDFAAGDVRKILNEIVEQNQYYDTIITDPPRAGIGRKVIKKIIRLHPRKIVYVSCNPATLAEDLKELCNCGYKLDKVVPVDMFPHTFHIESVSRLTREE